MKFLCFGLEACSPGNSKYTKGFFSSLESGFDPNEANGQDKKSSRDVSSEKLNVLKWIMLCRNRVLFLVGSCKQNRLDQLSLSLLQPLQLASI